MADNYLDRNVGYLAPAPASGGGGGSVNSVTASTGITVAGTAADPTVAINLGSTLAWTGLHTFTNSAAPVTSQVTDSGTATRVTALVAQHATSATAAVGIGSAIDMQVQNSSGTQSSAGRLVGLLRGVSVGSENGVIGFENNVGGTNTIGAWLSGSGIWFASTSLAIGSIGANGTSTNTATINITSTMLTYTSSLAANGGHSFAGTVNTSGARQFFLITPSANTGGTASTEIKKFEYAAYTNTWAAGAITTQREIVFNAPTYAFASASTITTAATLAISGAPIAGSNATLTKSHSLWIQGGLPRIDSFTANGAVATLLGSVGPTGASTTVQTWLTIDVNGTTRFIPCF